MLNATQRIEINKIQNAFGKTTGDISEGCKTISKYTGIHANQINAWYNENDINSKFFAAKDEALRAIKGC